MEIVFHVRGFKNLRDCRVRLGPFTCLVGPNGSGKSNLLRAIEALTAVVRRAPVGEWIAEGGGWKELATDGGRAPIELGVDVEHAGHVYKYQVGVGSGGGAGPHLVSETLDIDGRRRLELSRERDAWSSTLTAADGSPGREIARWSDPLGSSASLGLIGKEPGFDDVRPLRDFLAGWRVHDFQPAVLGWPAEARPMRSLDTWGEGLAAFVHTLATEEPERLTELRRLCQEAGTGIESLAAPYVEPAPTGATPRRVELRIGTQGTPVKVRGASAASGHLKALAILASLMERPAPTLLALEEPDAGLHPKLLQWLVEFLRRIAEDRMVVVTTHHPWFVDQMRLGELRVFEVAGGAVQVHEPQADGDTRTRIEAALGTLALTGSLR